MRKLIFFFKQYGLIIIAIFSLVLSFGVIYYSLTTFGSTQAVNETSVGYIYLGNHSTDEYETALNSGVSDWKTKASYRILFQGYEYDINLTLFDFDIISTLNNLTTNSKNDAIFVIDETNILLMKSELEAVFGTVIINGLDLDLLTDEILSDMGKLYYLRTYDMNSYLDVLLKDTVIDTFTISNISSEDVSQILSENTSFTINANSRFSLLDTFSSYPLTNEQLSIIASGIERIIFNTSFSGITKYHYQILPEWSQIGANVRILKVNLFDFQFFNNQAFDYTVTISQIDDNSLLFSLIGYPNVSQYQVLVDDSITIPYEVEIIDDETIDEFTPGVIIEETDTEWIYTVVEQVGILGHQIIFTRVTTFQDGSTSSNYLMNENQSPTSRIIRHNIVLKGD